MQVLRAFGAALAFLAASCAQVSGEYDAASGPVRVAEPLEGMVSGSAGVHYLAQVELVGPPGSRWCGLSIGSVGGWYPQLPGRRHRGAVDASRSVTVVLPERDVSGAVWRAMGYQCFVVDPGTGRRHFVTRSVESVELPLDPAEQAIATPQSYIQPLLVHVGGRDAESDARWAALRTRWNVRCTSTTPQPYRCSYYTDALWEAMERRDLG